MRKANQRESKAYEEKIFFGLKRLRNLKDEEIDYSDLPELAEAFFEKAVIVLPKPKASVSIRLDQEVLDWFKSQGKGYQTRINALSTGLHGGAEQGLMKSRVRTAHHS